MPAPGGHPSVPAAPAAALVRPVRLVGPAGGTLVRLGAVVAEEQVLHVRRGDRDVVHLVGGDVE